MCRELERYTYSWEINPRGRLYQTHKCRPAGLNAYRMNSNMHKHTHTHTHTSKPMLKLISTPRENQKTVHINQGDPRISAPYLNMSCGYGRNISCFKSERLRFARQTFSQPSSCSNMRFFLCFTQNIFLRMLENKELPVVPDFHSMEKVN